jgi:hypothetical protein
MKDTMMKKTALLLILFCFAFPVSSWADQFLEVPIIPGATIITQTDSRMEIKVGKSHDEVLKFYQNVFKDQQDVKYRDWKKATYIEDDGNMPWHSVTISGDGVHGASVVIVKDNWTWIIGTLILRFVAVFVVLLVLYVSMTLSGKFISWSLRRMEASKG